MRRARRVDGTAELDVIPVLSLIVHLIPMLLLGVRFVTLAQVPLSAPPVPSKPARDRGQFEAQEREVASVRVTRDGFSLGGIRDVDPVLPCAQRPCSVDDYPYDRLVAALVVAHEAKPADGRIVVAPDSDVPYEVVVRVMDTVRARKDGNGRETALFTQPLLATPPDKAEVP
jgi:biopolymer transport protein ExbD